MEGLAQLTGLVSVEWVERSHRLYQIMLFDPISSINKISSYMDVKMKCYKCCFLHCQTNQSIKTFFRYNCWVKTCLYDHRVFTFPPPDKGPDQQSIEQYDLTEQLVPEFGASDSSHADWYHLVWFCWWIHHDWHEYRGFCQQWLQLQHGIPHRRNGHAASRPWSVWGYGHHQQYPEFCHHNAEPEPAQQADRHVSPGFSLHC